MSVRIVAGQTKTIGVALASVANDGKFQVAPTIDANDWRISINGGSFAALTNTPTVAPSGGKRVQVVFAAAETTAAGAGGEIFLVYSDSSGNECYDLAIPFPVYANAEDTNITLADNAITNAKIAADAIGASELATDAITEIQSGLAKTTELPAAPDNAGIADIKTKTDNLPVDTAAVLAAIAAYIDTEIAAIKAKTDNLPASPAATGDIPSIANIWAHVVEGTLTAEQILRIALAAMAGKSTGGGTTAPAFRDVADAKNRIAAVVDNDGNRTTIVLDGT